MRLAVAYDMSDASVWQHFGRTEAFKFYELREGEIQSSEVVDATACGGHGALATFLAENEVDMLICGGLGQGIANAVMSYGIKLIPGVTGDADEAVKMFLAGELSANEEAVHAGCHHHYEEGAGNSCASHCGGGCHGRAAMDHEPVGNEGKTCRVHYTGTFNDGTKFDSSYDRGEPLEFVCGAGMMIKGFDEAVKLMEVGEIKDIHLMPEEAYGMPDPENIFTVELAELPGAEECEVGQQVYLTNQFGQPFPVMVAAKDDTTITFDANHEMAGKELNFKIELVEVV